MGKPGGVRGGGQSSPYAPPQQNKNSVLDKFKLFNNKEKNQDRGKASSGVSKRTSSSSGFSSARSEHSDSSTSLCDQSKLQVESPKSRALKSKLQSANKAGKQASPKTGRKEQSSKGQSKIARTKGAADKLLVYAAPPLEDVKPSGKIAASGTKMPPSVENKKSSNLHDLLKQQQQQSSGGQALQKANPSVLLTGAKQIGGQQQQEIAGKNHSKNENLARQQPIARPRMELPAKLDATKIHPQKVPPNGLNKDILAQKGLLLSNGMMKQAEDHDEGLTDENNSTIERTLSMNQANLCERMEGKRKEIGVDREDQTLDGKQGQVACIKGGRAETHEFEGNGRQTPSSFLPRNPTDATSVANDAKMTSIEEAPAATIGPTIAAPPCHVEQQQHHAVNFGAGKQHSVAGSGPLQGSSLIGSPGSSIPKPTALVKGTSKPPKENNMPGVPTPTKLKADALHRKLDPNTVAMVSPMPSISDLMSESSHSNSNSTGQSNSSDSSVIYRPSSESGSEIKTIPNRKIDTTFEQMEKVLNVLRYVLRYKCTRNTETDSKPDFAGFVREFNVRRRRRRWRRGRRGDGRRGSGDDGEAHATSAARLHAWREGPSDLA